MNRLILVLNAGSSSIKFTVFRKSANPGKDDLLSDGQVSVIGGQAHFLARDATNQPLVDKHLENHAGHETALAAILQWMTQQYAGQELYAAGHRVVHGGSRYSTPVLIDAAVMRELQRLVPLAPLHQPHHIAAIEALQRLHPALPQVACFDTAFHHAQTPLVTNYALPRALSVEGIRRYGFHGLSYEYIAGALPSIVGSEISAGKVIVAHLGAGASMCAMQNGRSVATTMGFTALDGLPMSRRCGALDPGVVLYLMQEKGLSADAISKMLYNESGLYGVSGGFSDDMQALLASDDAFAAEAVDMFVYRIGRELGSLAAAMGGMDALIFTAGIGEHSTEIRRRICLGAGWLGIELDADSNHHGDHCISTAQSMASAWIIPTNEDLMIARHTRQIMAGLRV